MNRHHFAVYIRHCKLELLLRRENENSATAEFRAAEWRWQTPEVCDGEWHSYAILFDNLDNVTLMVDGAEFPATERNPEILDDWPLHKTIHHNTKLIVGACWHGRSQSMVQHFKGSMSSMFLSVDRVENETSIACLHANHEKLQYNSEQLILGESVVFNKAQNQITLKANNLKDLTQMIRSVKYFTDSINPKQTKHRNFTIDASVVCTVGPNKTESTIPLGQIKTQISIKPPAKLDLSISGQNELSVDRKSLKTGSVMLPNIEITVTKNIDGTETDVTEHNLIDWCKVHLKPARDMDLEYFSSPAALISALNVDFEHDKLGIMLKGSEKAKSYAQILSKIHYYNTRSESYQKRTYTVQCSMNEGRVMSNEFFVTMSINDGVNESNENELDEAIEKLSSFSKKLDVEAQKKKSASAFDSQAMSQIDEYQTMKLEKQFEPGFDQLGANRLQNILEMDLPRPKALLSGSHHGYDAAQGVLAGSAIAIIVVVCIGLLLALLIVGVIKMKNTEFSGGRRGSRRSAMEGMEWDDNGMNLTINPLESVQKNRLCEEYNTDPEDQESLEDEESYREEDELTDDDEDEDGPDTQILPHAENSSKGLEWDDDHSIPMGTGSKTYCV